MTYGLFLWLAGAYNQGKSGGTFAEHLLPCNHTMRSAMFVDSIGPSYLASSNRPKSHLGSL